MHLSLCWNCWCLFRSGLYWRGDDYAGANYLGEVPSSEKLDLMATVKPAPSDVGKIATIVIVQVEGIGIYTKLPQGEWVAFDIDNLQGFATKTLAPSENIEILADLIGDQLNLAGTKFIAYVGYWVGDDQMTGCTRKIQW